jgi:hypothetical protein
LIKHRGFLTKNLVKLQDCIAKKCPFFEKLRTEYWQAVERAKEEKINRLKRNQ